jgi:hypothetical protein
MPGEFDVTVPNPARSGTTGSTARTISRPTGNLVTEALPTVPLVACDARRFLIDAVHQLVTEHGVRQFIDIGRGLPAADNTHQVAPPDAGLQ